MDYPETIPHALECVGKQPGLSSIRGLNMMLFKKGIYLLADIVNMAAIAVVDAQSLQVIIKPETNKRLDDFVPALVFFLTILL